LSLHLSPPPGGLGGGIRWRKIPLNPPEGDLNLTLHLSPPQGDFGESGGNGIKF